MSDDGADYTADVHEEIFDKLEDIKALYDADYAVGIILDQKLMQLDDSPPSEIAGLSDGQESIVYSGSSVDTLLHEMIHAIGGIGNTHSDIIMTEKGWCIDQYGSLSVCSDNNGARINIWNSSSVVPPNIRDYPDSATDSNLFMGNRYVNVL